MLNNRHTLSSVNQPSERISKYRTILWVALVLNSLTLVVLFFEPFLGGEYIVLSNKALYQLVIVVLIGMSIYFSKQRNILGVFIPLILYILLSIELLYIYFYIFTSGRFDGELFAMGFRGFRSSDLFEYLPHLLFKLLVILFMIKSINPFREIEGIGNDINSDILDGK